MPSGRVDEERDYGFADRALALRKRAGLTQRELAALLQVSGQSVHAWEAGLSYPGTEHLMGLIALYLGRGALATGQEEQQAEALWAGVRARAARRTPPFDPAWFAALRGLPDAASPVARASAPGPAAGGPPARPPTNLPPARTSFVRRAAEVASLARLLAPGVPGGARLLTLVGVAGCGKTRLARAVADAALDAYADGAWLVELAPLPASPEADPAPAAAAALAALGLREEPGRAATDTLVAHLRASHLLLVLDNCEHLAAAAAALAARLLAACPDLRILATSQYTLGAAEETVRRVGTLSVPPATQGAPTPAVLDLLGQSEAVQLFLERARDVQPGFALGPATSATAAAICRRLDGLPLASELAAARLDVLPVGEVLARLDDHFRLLRQGRRGAGDRHQALQATMD